MAKLKFEEHGTAPVMLNKLHLLKAFDQQVERSRKKWGAIWGASIVLAIALAIVSGVMSDKHIGDTPVIIAGSIAGIAGVTFIVALVIYIITVKKDLENRKLDAAVKLVEVISEDVPNDVNLSILVDFANYLKGGQMVSKEGGWVGVKNYVYVHPWLNFSGVLYDGNKFTLEVEQNVKRKEVPKRKYTKVKEKITEKATLTMKLNQKVYPNPQQVAGRVQAGMTPFGFEVKRAIGGERSMKISTVSPTASMVQGRYGRQGDDSCLLNGDRLLGMFIQAYQGLKQSRPSGEAPAAT